MAWEAGHGRRVPWRTTQDPYAIGVAEILLQKTKGADVEPVWLRLVAEYPDAAALASAEEAKLQTLIGGLGLGRQRAGRLKGMAQALLERGLEGQLPGLGSYGLAIVFLSCGREPEVPPVDGNIARVIARYHGFNFERGEPRKNPQVKEAVRRILTTLDQPEDKLQATYALVDLGASICVPSRPACSICPLVAWCVSARTGAVKGIRRTSRMEHAKAWASGGGTASDT